MAEEVYKYQVWCDTDSKYETVWAEEKPTTCPANDGHTIDQSKTTIIDQVANTDVEISNASFTATSKHMLVEVAPREGIGLNFYTPNFCDRTTWYEGSTAITEFAMTDSGDKTTWNTNGTHTGPWVDLTHGKIFAEDLITAATPAYLCKVEVSTDTGTTWVEKTENDFDATDDDFSVDYVNGTVTFNSALGVGDLVRASFSNAPSTLTYTIKPDEGKRVRLVHVECQMSIDIEFTTKVEYQVWAYNPYDFPNKVQVKASVYKTIMDFLYESTGVYPTFPKIDATGARGIPEDIIVVPFNYTASRDILDSQGIEIRVVMDKEFAGHVCNCTFYCLSEDEDE